MPNYPALAAQGIYTDASTGIRVFAGQRAETFYIDLGAVFDTLNLRRYLPLLTGPGEDTDTVNPFGVNRFSGSNVNTIAIEVPIKAITSDGKPAVTAKHPVIGMYASAARQRTKELGRDGEVTTRGPWVQVSRMANPLVNELIITTPFKDQWNSAEPEEEANFQAFYREPRDRHGIGPRLWRAHRPDRRLRPQGSHRSDEHPAQVPGQELRGQNCTRPCAELLRLDLRVPPTAPSSRADWGRR